MKNYNYQCNKCGNIGIEVRCLPIKKAPHYADFQMVESFGICLNDSCKKGAVIKREMMDYETFDTFGLEFWKEDILEKYTKKEIINE